jgi:hypothetical protein
MVKQWKKSLTGDDVQAEAEDALEKDISQMSPAANSVADNLDGGVAAVDWSSKTPEIVYTRTEGYGPIVSVSGSGYITGIRYDSDTPREVNVHIDGDQKYDTSGYDAEGSALLHRFESSFELQKPESTTDHTVVIVGYVLD